MNRGQIVLIALHAITNWIGRRLLILMLDRLFRASISYCSIIGDIPGIQFIELNYFVTTNFCSLKIPRVKHGRLTWCQSAFNQKYLSSPAVYKEANNIHSVLMSCL